jgi:serine/threonine protein kinase
VDVIGATFGEFQLIRAIGKGAVAHVFLASDGQAIKAVKLFPPEFKARADRELVFGSGLDHPHLNSVYEAVNIRGYPGVLMPFVPGVRLSEWLAQGRSRAAFLRVLGGVVKGLAYLHDRGFVHRDIKGENIMISGEDHARLLDFDLATHAESAEDRNVTAGTIAFLSPEQGRGGPVTAASDLYSLGILLYWGLTGEVPFTGSVREVLAAHGATEPRPLAAFDRNLQRYQPLIARLLAKDPADRVQDALELLPCFELLISEESAS